MVALKLSALLLLAGAAGAGAEWSAASFSSTLGVPATRRAAPESRGSVARALKTSDAAGKRRARWDSGDRWARRRPVTTAFVHRPPTAFSARPPTAFARRMPTAFAARPSVAFAPRASTAFTPCLSTAFAACTPVTPRVPWRLTAAEVFAMCVFGAQGRGLVCAAPRPATTRTCAASGPPPTTSPPTSPPRCSLLRSAARQARHRNSSSSGSSNSGSGSGSSSSSSSSSSKRSVLEVALAAGFFSVPKQLSAAEVVAAAAAAPPSTTESAATESGAAVDARTGWCLAGHEWSAPSRRCVRCRNSMAAKPRNGTGGCRAVRVVAAAAPRREAATRSGPTATRGGIFSYSFYRDGNRRSSRRRTSTRAHSSSSSSSSSTATTCRRSRSQSQSQSLSHRSNHSSSFVPTPPAALLHDDTTEEGQLLLLPTPLVSARWDATLWGSPPLLHIASSSIGADDWGDMRWDATAGNIAAARVVVVGNPSNGSSSSSSSSSSSKAKEGIIKPPPPPARFRKRMRLLTRRTCAAVHASFLTLVRGPLPCTNGQGGSISMLGSAEAERTRPVPPVASLRGNGAADAPSIVPRLLSGKVVAAPDHHSKAAAAAAAAATTPDGGNGGGAWELLAKCAAGGVLAYYCLALLGMAARHGWGHAVSLAPEGAGGRGKGGGLPLGGLTPREGREQQRSSQRRDFPEPGFGLLPDGTLVPLTPIPGHVAGGAKTMTPRTAKRTAERTERARRNIASLI